MSEETKKPETMEDYMNEINASFSNFRDDDMLIWDKLTQMKEDLSVEAQLVNSAEYMEQQARETLRMIKDGELLFIISDENPSQEEQTQ